MDIHNVLQHLLHFSVSKGASDLHISTGSPPLMRVDGEIIKAGTDVINAAQVQAMIQSVLSVDEETAFNKNKEADFAYQVKGLARFRVNAFYHQYGPALVVRVIPESVLSLLDLSAPAILTEIADAQHGLVLVTGATGAGKSTTLAAMVDHINSHRRQHILTIEDPIEFVHTNKLALISQREVNRHTKSFNAALRSALREDPDVILVGELRDIETMRLALTAAETGHLVFATLHTTSAPKTIHRIIDAFPGDERATVRSMLAESLHAVVTQVLVKGIQGGRVAAYEIMIATPAIKNLIREGKVAQMYSALQTGAAFGMQTLEQGLRNLVEQRVVHAKSIETFLSK